jgi:hypothetical protein
VAAGQRTFLQRRAYRRVQAVTVMVQLNCKPLAGRESYPETVPLTECRFVVWMLSRFSSAAGAESL